MILLPLFKANDEATERIVVDQGGTSSGKTIAILQVLHKRAISKRKRIDVAGISVPHLKQGAYGDFQRLLNANPEHERYIIDHHQTDRRYTYSNGSYIQFLSFENEQKARGPRRDILYVNECNGLPYETFWQLKIRTEEQIFLDYNPSSKFWVHEKLLGTEGVKLIISDHRTNYALTKERHDEIEGIEDPELFKVYARGLTGKITGLIYPNFQLIDQMPGLYKSVYGLDFGYNHKTGLIEVAKDGNRIFWNELIYKSEVTIGDLIQLMKPLDLGRKDIYADHAAADKIEDLKRAGFNVHKADKDVLNGIDFVKRNSLYITKSSTGIRKEIMSYKWKVDRTTGVTLDEPVKFNDDGMDAGRYGSYSHFRKNKAINISGPSSMIDDDPLDW